MPFHLSPHVRTLFNGLWLNPAFEDRFHRKLHPPLLDGFESLVRLRLMSHRGDENADFDASYEKEESFYKDENLESPRARAC
jgi:hypothetical protein